MDLKKLLMLVICPFFAREVSALEIEAPKSVKQGGVIRVVVKVHESNRYNYLVYFRRPGEKLQREFLTAPVTGAIGSYSVLIPVSVDEASGHGNICAENEKYGICRPVEIKKVDFPESKKTFYVYEPTPEILKKFLEQRAFLDAIYAQITLEKYFSGDLLFQNPLDKMEMVENAGFGQIRKRSLVNPKTRRIKDRWKDYHKGIDLKAFSGTPVFAGDDGKIAVARNLLGSGNTVIIDHGYGLLSLYFHLSKLSAKEGEDVKKGQKIGLVGMSGNAEGPHLHFEVRLLKIPVNPSEFLRKVAE